MHFWFLLSNFWLYVPEDFPLVSFDPFNVPVLYLGPVLWPVLGPALVFALGPAPFLGPGLLISEPALELPVLAHVFLSCTLTFFGNELSVVHFSLTSVLGQFFAFVLENHSKHSATAERKVLSNLHLTFHR